MRLFRGIPLSLDSAADRSWLRRLGVGLIAAKVALVPLVFDPRATIVFGLPKASVSRALLYATCVVLAAYVIRRGPRVIGWSPLWLAAVPYAIVSVAATATALDTRTALFGVAERYLGLTAVADGLILAFSVAIFVRRPRDWLLLAAAGLGAASICLLYGFAQVLRLDPIPWDNPAIFSTIGNAGPFAEYIVTVAAATASVLVMATGRIDRRLRWALAGFLVLALLAVVRTQARASLFGLPIAAVAVVVLARRGGLALPRISRRRLGLIVAGTGAGLVAAAVLVLPSLERAVGLATGGDTSTRERAVIYGVALEIARTHPLLGVGPDNFAVLFPTLRPPDPALTLSASVGETSAHSWVLKAATDAGIFGLASYVAFALVLLRSAWRRAAVGELPAVAAGAALIVFLAQGAVATSDVSTDWLFWLAAGVLTAPTLRQPDAAEPRTPGRRRGRARTSQAAGVDRPHAIAAGLVGVALALTTVNAVQASELRKASAIVSARGDHGTAIRLAREATSRDGGRGEYWYVLGLVLSSAGDNPGAVAALQRATEVTPYVPLFWSSLAEGEVALAAAGRTELRERARRDAEHAVALAPNDPGVHYRLARVLLALGNAADAIVETERAWALEQRDTVIAQLFVNAYEQLGRYSKAVEWQRVVLERDPTMENRLRLARLLIVADERDAARALFRPPQVQGADRTCTSPNGSATSADGKTVQPRCFRVVFISEAALQSEPSRSDSVTSPGNFMVDGRALPATTVISYDPARAIALVQLPSGDTPPGENAVLVVRRVANIIGFPIQPEPTVVRLP